MLHTNNSAFNGMWPDSTLDGVELDSILESTFYLNKKFFTVKKKIEIYIPGEKLFQYF